MNRIDSAARRRCSSRGRSRATATSAACTAAPSRRPASACPTSSTPTRRCASPTRSSATACPTSCCAAASRWSSRISSRSPKRSARAGVQPQDRDQRPALRCATSPTRLARLPIRSMQISLDGDTEEIYAAPAAGRLARAGARRLPRRARRGPAARDHVRADPAQHPRGRAGDRAGPLARRLPLQHRPADAHRHRRAALGQARARRRRNIGEFRAVLERQRGVLEGAMELCYDPFTMAKGCARASPSRRRRCWCCPTAGSRWRRRCRTSAPICAATSLREAWEAYRDAWRDDTVLAAVRGAIADAVAPRAKRTRGS